MNIYDNKPKITPTWQLKICISMGRYVGDQWTTDNNISPFNIDIYYDNSKLELGSIIGTHCFEFEDTTETQDHNLKLVISDVTEERWQDLLRCQFFIEDLDIGYVVENFATYVDENNTANSGTETMGINGTQMLRIQTPIYKWLLDNKQDILSKARSTS